jgi:hypothetical protein
MSLWQVVTAVMDIYYDFMKKGVEKERQKDYCNRVRERVNEWR